MELAMELVQQEMELMQAMEPVWMMPTSFSEWWVLDLVIGAA